MKVTLIGFLLALSTLNLKADEKTTHSTNMDECLLNAIKQASSEQTVEELRQSCHEETLTLFKQRLALEKQAAQNRFAIIPHKPNYVMPASIANLSRQPYANLPVDTELDNVEVKFQISLKYLAMQDLIFRDLDLQFAFTATSWWQAYNSDISAPFRETNYEPEVILNYHHSWSLFGLPIEQTSLSLNHQSNGQPGQLSRSWNRVILGFTFAPTDNILWGFRTWYRIPEQQKLTERDPTGDDNPNIEKYMGYGEIGGLWSISESQSLEFMLRNNLRSDNKGAIQLGWTFPLNKRIQGYIEYFNGYGESLIYYDQHTQRLGIGIKLTNWL